VKVTHAYTHGAREREIVDVLVGDEGKVDAFIISVGTKANWVPA
jgi:hypothetical protein